MKIYRVLSPRLAARLSVTGMGALIVLSIALLAGCGGGGGGGGSSSGGGGGGSTIGTEPFSGTVETSSGGSPGAGYTLQFDNLTPVPLPSSGAFTLNIPTSDITGSDYIAVLNSSNTQVSLSAKLINDTDGYSNLLLSIGPPPAPPLAIKQ